MSWLQQFRDRITSWSTPESLGVRGERAAARFLKRQGYIIVAHGERDRIGEIDLVAIDGKTIVFVEVKTRASHDRGHPAEAVDQDKQRRLTRVALSYLRRHDLLEYSARFDVVAITWPPDQKQPTIEHFKNAFEAVGTGQMFN
ncbi:MAG TPA: YraN family protein [Pirellulaceae bacterium]|nr:YraN family protein [Planctomycetales bacterium]MCB9939823.1 YraN family protein [Planctomycetaceae bacterium]HRX80362.1 YraN family protein [Pirellulaceae bacterium]